ncbi:MAG: carboxylesterase family protein [Paludibacter sp.]|nr:carboxylesterase family protein [Paludibacter sp.]
MKKPSLFILAFCSFFLNVIAVENNFAPVFTKVENGMIQGILDKKTGLQMYFGVPFAKPPVGELRWKAPQTLENWNGVLQTTKFGPKPVQVEVFGKMNSRLDTMSEDCLYLNVWAPLKKNTKALPVLVYFFGGGFVAGDGAEPRYDGAAMAQKGIVAVTVNYRLNIFGFFAHPELSAEAPYKASGNYGYLDQNAALRWVKNNIAAFGGDPKRVTIAGESAGSISVSAQMASPLSKNLIAGAIGESGAAINPTLAPIPLKEAEKIGLEFAEKAGYASLKALRALSTKEVLDIYVKSKRFGFPSVVDSYFFTKTLPEIFKAREQAQVPLLVGWNSAEIPGMAFMNGKTYNSDNFVSRIKEMYPNDYEEVLKLYAHSTEKEVEVSATELASDRFIVYSTWKWFDLQRKNSTRPVYRYLFCHPRPALKDKTLNPGLAGGTIKKETNAIPTFKAIGAAHSEEIEYCMGNLYLAPEYSWEKEDYKVSETMQSYFANFIISGNPNGQNLPEWPSAKANNPNPPVMMINVVSKAIPAQNDERFLFLDKNYKNN